MAPKTTKAAIKDSLANLSQDKFAEFVEQLLDRRTPPKVRRSEVEGKSRLAVTNLLVSTFTESKAPQVVQEILRDIGCSDEADELAAETGGTTSQPGSCNNAGPSSGAAAGNQPAGKSPEEHFVDKHELELINRVSNVNPILDGLLKQQVIDREKYMAIRKMITSCDQIRAVYVSLQSGVKCKDIFYELVKKHEKFLFEELEKL
ncbi:apoptosis-associated speck-like protein containing a CARD isoform X2 [Echeneis naucrates]|uniref:apoptosis-associated speck-like protein containing a CARD isoform X2 n=1 Tax=Echeneis naucrates TaxID=173247 RepID=UPI0011135CC5|nr:apoptosis-associated speck-like protein containing a CARD isoform X2 [Echeneis naucrates]